MNWEASADKSYSKFVIFIASVLLMTTLIVLAFLPALITLAIVTLSFSFSSFWFVTTVTLFAMMTTYVIYISKSTMKRSNDYKINPWDDLSTSPGIEEDVSTNN